MKTIRQTGLFAALLALALLLTACGGTQTASTADTRDGDAHTSAADDTPSDGGALRHVTVSVENYGDIKLELDAAAAPETVANFVALAQDGFYDGLTFHRIMDGFMIQGGDTDGNGFGGSGRTIVGEFAANGHDNPISHTAGVISMARAKDPDSASSQFFITVADATFLDGQYAAFGHVTEGLDIAKQIAKDARPIDSNGTIPPEEQPVITAVTVTD